MSAARRGPPADEQAAVMLGAPNAGRTRARRGETSGGRRGERGAAAVLVMALAGVLLLVGVTTVWLAGLVVAHRRAQAAADLAALAGAAAHQHSRPACAAAIVTAAANAAEVTACTLAAADVRVQVAVPAPTLLGLQPSVTARAHAGPAP